MHILDVKLGSRNGAAPGRSPHPLSPANANTQVARKQQQLNVLIEAMKTYTPQYDGVDWVSEAIRHIINLAQLDPDPAGHNPSSAPPHSPSKQLATTVDWTDILASHPSAYLRLALTVDLSLSKGRLPEERDFPVSLRGIFGAGSSPLRRLLERAASRSRDPIMSRGLDLDGGRITALPSSDEEGGESSPDGETGMDTNMDYSSVMVRSTPSLHGSAIAPGRLSQNHHQQHPHHHHHHQHQHHHHHSLMDQSIHAAFDPSLMVSGADGASPILAQDMFAHASVGMDWIDRDLLALGLAGGGGGGGSGAGGGEAGGTPMAWGTGQGGNGSDDAIALGLMQAFREPSTDGVEVR